MLHDLDAIVNIQISNYKQLHEAFFIGVFSLFLTCHVIANMSCIISLTAEDI